MKNRALLTIFLIVFIDLLGFGIILPLLPYIAEKYQATPLQIGFLTAAYSIFQLISAPFLGRLSDRYGRKKLLIISQLGSVIGYLILAFAHNLFLLFLSRLIDGVTGGNISIAQAYIADITNKKNRARGMGLIGAAFGLGFIFGPALGGILSKISFSTPAFFAAFIGLSTVLTTSLFLKETVVKEKIKQPAKTRLSLSGTLSEIKKLLGLSPINNLIITFFILNTAFSLATGIFALWSERTFKFDASKNGFLFTYIGVLAVIFQTQLLPWVNKKFSERKILFMALFFLFIGIALMPIVKQPSLLLIILFFLSLGNSLANPTIQALVSENVVKEEYGKILGLLQSAGSLGRIFGPIIGGVIFQTIGKDAVFYLGGVLIIINCIYLQIKLDQS